MSTRSRHIITLCVWVAFAMVLAGCQRSKPPRTVVPYYPGNMAAEPTVAVTATVASLVATSTPMSYPAPITPTLRPTITLAPPTATSPVLPTSTPMLAPATATAPPYVPPATPTWTAVAPPTLAPTVYVTPTAQPTAIIVPSGDLTYTVSAGDTLISLADTHSTTVYAIMDRNGLYDPNTIRIGQSLVIPVGSQVTGSLPTGPVWHVVQKGDTLSSLARQYRTTVGEIQAQNPGAVPDPNALKVGTALSITVGTAPVVRTHVVQHGDTLSNIARRYGTTMRALAEANPVANPNRLRVGQVLVIP